MMIKERAKAIINKKYSGWDFELKRWATECCVEIATEQDAISRQKEREECAQKAENWYCYNMCEYLKTHGGGCDWLQHSKCDIPERIRKAISQEGDD